MKLCRFISFFKNCRVEFFLFIRPKTGIPIKRLLNRFLNKVGIYAAFGHTSSVFSFVVNTSFCIEHTVFYIYIYQILQCIPTPPAWYAHQLPGWFEKLSVAAT